MNLIVVALAACSLGQVFWNPLHPDIPQWHLKEQNQIAPKLYFKHLALQLFFVKRTFLMEETWRVRYWSAWKGQPCKWPRTKKKEKKRHCRQSICCLYLKGSRSPSRTITFRRSSLHILANTMQGNFNMQCNKPPWASRNFCTGWGPREWRHKGRIKTWDNRRLGSIYKATILSDLWCHFLCLDLVQ